VKSSQRIVPGRMTEDAIDPDRAPRSTWQELRASDHLRMDGLDLDDACDGAG
jgi:hypothetical protein